MSDKSRCYKYEEFKDKPWTTFSKEERQVFLEGAFEWMKSLHPEKFVPNQPIEKEQLREILLEDFRSKKNMTVEEYTLFMKWNEIQKKFAWVKPKVMQQILYIRDNIWKPEDENSYMDIEPEVICCRGNEKLMFTWNTLRTFTHTQVNNQNLGRNIYFLVNDKVTGKHLGAFCLSSDFLDVACRDDKIGWTREQRAGGHMINHTYIGSTIVPTQPLGFNFVGGKLLALLMLTDDVQNAWTEAYGEIAVGCTTTNLYQKPGGMSQYTGLKYWKSVGCSKGTVSISPTPENLQLMKNYMMVDDTWNYWKYWLLLKPGKKDWFLPKDNKNRFIKLAFGKKRLDIPTDEYQSGHARGVHWCDFYTNTKEFLRGEIEQKDLIKRFDGSTEAIVAIWKKYAAKRVKSLLKNDRLDLDESLFYNDLLVMDWPEARAKYLGAVGR